jgi:hypothetical protein
MKIKFFNLYIFLFIFIILIIYYVNTQQSSCCCKKKEGMTTNISSGGMKGYIKRQIHPLKRQIKSSFISSSTMTDYYTNKLNQMLR